MKGLVSMSLVPAQLIDCVRWEEKKASEGRIAANVIKNSGGRQRIPMCCEWGHLVGYEEGHWPLPQLHTPPLCLSLPPPQLMIHNGFLCFNGTDAHTGSFLPVHIAVGTQVLSVNQARYIALFFFFLCIAFITWFIVLAGCTVLNVLFSKLLSDVVYAT